MTDRATVFEITQVGVESVKGTSVAANKYLQATQINPQINTEPNEFGPQGFKYNTVVVHGKEWTTADVTGVGSYTDPVYLLSGMFGAAVITTPGGGTLSRDWVWTPASNAADDPKTLTVETGSAARAEKFSYGLFQALGLAFSRSAINVTGTMLGQLTTDGITMTGSPTAIPLQPIVPNQVDVYIDSAFGSIGTTKLTRAIEANWSVGDKFNPIWVLNSANNSHAGTVETKPTPRVDLTLGADSNGMALLTNLRAGSTFFLRIKCTGPIIEAAIPYLLQIDCACKVLTPNPKGDADGLRTMPWGLEIVHDSGWGKAMQIKMTNTLTAL